MLYEVITPGRRQGLRVARGDLAPIEGLAPGRLDRADRGARGRTHSKTFIGSVGCSWRQFAKWVASPEGQAEAAGGEESYNFG